MHEILSCLSTTVLFVIILWTSSFKSCLCTNDNDNNKNHTAATDCDFTESYDEVVTVSVEEPVYVITYKWCLDIPPRCPDNRRDFRTVHKNITIPKTRTVKRCCKDQIQLYDDCVANCTEEQCPNIQCVPGTDMCKCKSGYKGHLCRQKCDIGYWGAGCKNNCHRACSDCDHRTGCCYTAISRGLTNIVGLKFCVKRPTTIVSVRTGRHEHGEIGTKSSSWVHQEPEVDQTAFLVKLNTSNATTQEPSVMPETRFKEVSAEGIMVVEEPTATSIQQPSRTRTDSDGFVGTVTTMQVTVYKYDELVTKLIWISVMTVVSIAMVFVIMFVVFFNCYGVSKLEDFRTQNRRLTSIVKNDDTYKQNMSHIPPDRYTKTPVLHTSKTNADSPIPPEIFCPVFSAPHYTGGSALYDSPQPLYEILC